MRTLVAGIGDAGSCGDSFCRDHQSRRQELRSAETQTDAMGTTRSCQFDKFATLQIGKGFADVGGQHFKIDIVLLGQAEHDLV
jgi:hypothetical protein